MRALLTRRPSARPGKINALLHWPGTNFLPPSVTGPKGLPLAKSARPLLYLYASSAVHSALLVGLLSAKMMGRSLNSAIMPMTRSLKVPACADTPMMHVGRSALTAASIESTHSTPSCTYGSLCGAMSPRGRLRTSRPALSTKNMRLRASGTDSFAPLTRASTSRSAMPVAAMPAPKKRKRCLSIGVLVALTDARIPATHTAAVPWMSSLKQHETSRNFCKRRNAFVLPKSSK